MRRIQSTVSLTLLIAMSLSGSALAASLQKPAVAVAAVERAPLLAATRAGKRIVAVGDHGMVLLSDDEGRGFRQAASVPTQALLTSLSFVSSREGWAAGHDGVVLHTQDGGEHWTLCREDVEGDRPLFAVRFFDAQRGLAVGLFGNALQTQDGGRSWTPLALGAGALADRHLYGIFGEPDSVLLIAAEQGLLYRSVDGGLQWQAVQTANPGSFWTGARLRSGRLLAAGQRGHVFLSDDQGLSWREVPSGTQQSLTRIIEQEDGSLWLLGLGGTMLLSRDGGEHFESRDRADRGALTAAVSGRAGAVLFSLDGVLRTP